MSVKRVTLRQVNDSWKACEEFNANNTLRGEYVSSVWGETMGRLNEYERSRLQEWAFMAKNNPAAKGLFVVFSYATPIAWAIVYNDGRTERYKVAQKFSVTTSKHWGCLSLNY
jgi:hypothetical protein